MANNFTKFDAGLNLKPSTAVLTDQGDIKYDSSISAFVGNAGGVTGEFILNPSSEALTAASLSTTGNLNVGGNASITGTAVIQGAATLASVTANSLTVTGNSVLAAMSANSQSVTGNSVLGALSANSLSVTGDSILGALTASSETVTGNLLVNGTATVGTLAVTGTGSITGALSITGNETLQGSLTVNNAATITGQLAVSGQALLGNRATFTQIATPASPAASSLSVYSKNDNKLYKLTSAGVESEIGAGALGGFNFLTMVTGSFAQTQTDNSNFEGSIGGWALYNDGANAAPTAMNGGTPTGTTLVTTGTNPLDGASSLQFTKDAANRQGQGFSCTANVPLAYRGQNATIVLPFKITGGSIVQGDLKVFARALDGAASGTITPFNNDIVGNQGILYSTLPLPSDATQYRIGVHVASTGAVATTAVFDDIQFGPQQATLGVPSSEWTEYTLTVGATTTAPTPGTIVSNKARWRRVGDSIEIRYDFEQSSAGTAGSGTYLYPLPAGLTIDSAKLVTTNSTTNRRTVGPGTGSSTGQGRLWGTVEAFNSTNLAVLVGNQTAGAEYLGSTFAGLDSTTQITSFIATVPIAGWSSNVTIANSSTYKISSYLESGTRVTTTPTLLGQYRCYYYTGSDASIVDTAPTNPPSASDGIKIYAKDYTPSGSAGSPQTYEIFVGKNKNVKFEAFAGTGKTLNLFTDLHDNNSSAIWGTYVSYDSFTGVAKINGANSWTLGNRYLGRTNDLGIPALTNYTIGYFDIIVSENALAVASDVKPQLVVRPSTGASVASAFGTTFTGYNTPIINTHSAFTSGVFTAPETGYYQVCSQFCDAITTALLGVRLIKNSTTYAESFNLGSSGTINPFTKIDILVQLSAGDTLSFQVNDGVAGTLVSVAERLWVSISKVSN